MQVSVLGPVEIVSGDEPVELDAPKERAVLTALALRAGDPVPVGRIMEAVWGDRPPGTATKTLQGHISGLRRAIGADAVGTDTGSYTLRVERSQVDACRFEDLVTAGRQAARSGEHARAARLFDDGLSLWRGTPLPDCADGPFRQGQVTRLEELRLTALEGHIDAELSLGHPDEVIPELEGLVAQQPLHEPFWAQLMLALYRCGRQADALRAYQRLRRRLREELGIEPSLEVQRLESRMLLQDERLEADPPPPPENLPAPLSSLVGRGEDARLVAKRVLEHRLVTLLGMGGVGKTRLALEAGRALVPSQDDGVWWVDLASVDRPGRVPAQVATTLGVAPAGDLSTREALVAHLRMRRLLLILDNCEHLAAETAELVVDLLEAAPGVTVLATSQVALGVPGEFHVTVEPLATPRPGMTPEEAACAASVRLFVQRAEDHGGRLETRDDMAAVIEICRRLEGVPLAIELAAARVRHLSPAQILERLDDRLGLLTQGPAAGDPRHRTLRTSIEWSCDLLDEADRRLLDRLAVFPASFDLDAAIAMGVSSGIAESEVEDRLTRLVDRSLVVPVVDAAEERRFRLLESLRQVGREHLEARDELDQARQAHADHFRGVVRRVADQFDTVYVTPWVARAARDGPSLLAAVGWSQEHDDPATALEFAPAAVPALWGGDQRACARTLEQMIERGVDAPHALRARALLQLGWPAHASGDPDRSRAALDRAIDLYRVAGDETGLAVALDQRAIESADIEVGLASYHEVLDLCDRLGLRRLRAKALTGMAIQLLNHDRLDDIDPAWLDEAEQTHGDDAEGLAMVYFIRTMVAWATGAVPAMEAAASAWLDHSRAIGSWAFVDRAEFFLRLARAQQGQSDLDLAEPLLRTARRSLTQHNAFVLALTLRSLAGVVGARGKVAQAVRLWTAGAALYRAVARGVASAGRGHGPPGAG